MDAAIADKTEASPQEGAAATMRHDVFISCTPDDQAVAETISTRLKQRKLSSWYPLRDVVDGEDEQTQIDAAIRASKAVVLAFTDAANASAEVLREMSVAIDADVEVVPFKLTSALPVMGLEYYLSTLPWVDGTTEPIGESARSLAATVSELVRKSTGTNKLTELWQRAKDSDGSEDISDMGVPVTIVIPEQGSWETEAPADGTQEHTLPTGGVPVTIVYPEAGSWELTQADGATSGDGGAEAQADRHDESGDTGAQAAVGHGAEGADGAGDSEGVGPAPAAQHASSDEAQAASANGEEAQASSANGTGAQSGGFAVGSNTTESLSGQGAAAQAGDSYGDPGMNPDDASSASTNDADASSANAAEDTASTNESTNSTSTGEGICDSIAMENATDGSEATVGSPEEELLSVSVEAAKQLREMAKKDEDGPAPMGDIIKVAIALILAAGTLLYLLITSIKG